MNNRIASIAVGLMLLISTAAAIGNNNQISVNVHQEAEGNCVTGEAYIAQISDAVAFVEGNNNNIEQEVNLYINDNFLTGIEVMPSSITQFGCIVGNITGNDNHLSQNIYLNAHNNHLTMGSMSQEAAQKADVIGNGNQVSQNTYADSNNDLLILSNLRQFSLLKASDVTGNNNIVDQSIEQLTEYNSLTNSKVWQLAVGNSSSFGNRNSHYLRICQDADTNHLTSSELRQVSEVAFAIKGNGNRINPTSMYTKMSAKHNSLDAGATEFQQVLEEIDILGNDNTVSHDISLSKSDNTMTGGTFAQESKVITNL